MGRARDWLTRCLDFYAGDQLAEAADMAAEGLRHAPEDGGLWQLRGLILHRLGRHAEACESLETAGLLVPLSPAAACTLADCHARAGRRGLARDLYVSLAADRACPASLLPAVSSGLGGLGEDAAALEVCRELGRREPGCHEAVFGQAYFLRRLGHGPEEVLPLIARAHELGPDVSLYRVALASLLARSGAVGEACELIRPVDLRSVRCHCCLRRMMDIFRLAGDARRLAGCRPRADEAEGRG